jgi:hypothetical protein
MTRRPTFPALLVAAVVLAAAGSYLTGYVFLWSTTRAPEHATPLTAIEVGLARGQDPQVRGQLLLSAAIGFGLVAATGAVLLVPAGDLCMARPASRAAPRSRGPGSLPTAESCSGARATDT